MRTVCEIPNESSEGTDESYQVLLSHPVKGLRKTSQLQAEQQTTSLSQTLGVLEINSKNENVLYDSLLRSRVPLKANICPPNIEANVFKCVTIKKAVGRFPFQNTCQLTAMQGEMCKLFMMGSTIAVQDTQAQVPDLR